MLNQKIKPRKLLGIFGNQKCSLEFKTLLFLLTCMWKNTTIMKQSRLLDITESRRNKEEFLKHDNCSYITFLLILWEKKEMLGGIYEAERGIRGAVNRNI